MACPRCVRAGQHNDTYTYTDDETGLPCFTLYAIGGSVVGVGHSSKIVGQFSISGSTAPVFGQSGAFASGLTSKTPLALVALPPPTA